MATTNTSLAGGNSSSLFGVDTQPVGSDFKNPVLVAAIVVNGLCAISFAILVVVSWLIKNKRKKGRRVFRVLTGITFIMFLSYLRTTGDEIAQELNANTPTVYVALFIIEKVLSTSSDTALPFVIYRVIGNRLVHIQKKANDYSTVIYAHLAIAGLIVVLGVVDAALDAYGQIFATDNSTEMVYGLNATNWYRNLDLTYTTVYCAVALEMFACAIFIFNKSKSVDTPLQITKYLMIMVTPFLIIRTVVNVAFSVIYVYLAYDEQKLFGLINAVLLGIPSIVLYTGLIRIGFSEEEWSMVTASYIDVIQDEYESAIVGGQEDGPIKQLFTTTVNRY